MFPLQLICSKYDHLLFENFEMTKHTFVEEQTIFQNARNLKSIINLMFSEFDTNNRKTSNTLNKSTHKYDQSKLDIKSLDFRNIKKLKEEHNHITSSLLKRKQLQSSYLRYRYHTTKNNYSYDFEKIYSNIPRTELLIAALKGVIMLQDTYGPDIRRFSKGDLNLKNITFIRSRSSDVLQVEDLVSMSGIAFNDLHWYDTSIRYLKQAINKFSSTSRKPYNSSFFEHILQECLVLMKKWYSSYHNELLNKMGYPIKLDDYKLFPVMINEGNRSMASLCFVRC